MAYKVIQPQNFYQTKKQTSGYKDPFPSLGQGGGGQSTVQVKQPKQQQAYKAAKPPPPPVYQQQQAPQQQAPVVPKVGYSYDTDPILNQINSLATQSEEGAQANATKLRQQLAVEFGDKNLAQMVGGGTLAQSAAENPHSIAAQLAKSYSQGQESLEGQLNDANLFYSGARIKQLAELGSDYGAQQAGAANSLAGQLAGIESSLNSAQYAAAKERMRAEQEAAARALAAQLAAGGAAATPPPGPTAGQTTDGNTIGLGSGQQEQLAQGNFPQIDFPTAPAGDPRSIGSIPLNPRQQEQVANNEFPELDFSGTPVDIGLTSEQSQGVLNGVPPELDFSGIQNSPFNPVGTIPLNPQQQADVGNNQFPALDFSDPHASGTGPQPDPISDAMAQGAFDQLDEEQRMGGGEYPDEQIQENAANVAEALAGIGSNLGVPTQQKKKPQPLLTSSGAGPYGGKLI